jgi:dienelactone hydrolase
VSYEGQIAETVTIVGHGGDRIAAYFARPIGATSVPGVVVFHHAPGWDEWSKDQVNRTEAELKRQGKDHELHRYDGAGHGFFATDRPNYRQAQAVDGWQKVFAFYRKHLVTA